MKKLENIMISSVLVGVVLSSVALAGVTNYLKKIDQVSGPEAAGLLVLISTPMILGSVPMICYGIKEFYKDIRSHF